MLDTNVVSELMAIETRAEVVAGVARSADTSDLLAHQTIIVMRDQARHRRVSTR